ncbi:hypothetical protein PGSY75_0718600 [Plasmodium gaboni]|uniref:Uncharacterized protein n=1 Tax=Plasmodium gaboni TaxID=647221 RepID=A0A151LQ54_9APIC|nr:hypothetical protein PGSY75_0718600 [Plasmodium gaboni]KYO01324.1 hypothetical protein PGSY75_0718600 [Plasmodium gaboni]
MIGMNHDFLSANFVGYPMEEKKTLCYQDFNINKKRTTPLKYNNFNNYEYLKELDDLREYKRITCEKIKKYESSIYSYKNQLRNVNKKKLDGGKINLKLLNIFVNIICDIIEYLCSDINKSVLSVLPFIHTILNTSPIRDKKIYQCSKLIHITLTHLNCKNVVHNKDEILREEIEKDYDLRTHKLDDLEWLACETNDKGWLAISDRWETCPKDLKWLCVKRNNRSWILYRHIWENSSDDLKYIAILFDDKKWLHLYKIWKLIPLSLKFKAINSRDVTICKPSLSEIIYNNNNIYNNDIYDDENFVNINSYNSSSIKNNYRTSSMMGNYYLRYNNMVEKIWSSKLYENMQKREDALEESLKYDLYKTQMKKKKSDDNNKDKHILKHINTKKGVIKNGADNLNDKLLMLKEIEKDKKENESFKNGIIHSIHAYEEDKEKQYGTDSRVVIQKGMSKSVQHEERGITKKKEEDKQIEKDDKRDIRSYKQLDINIINKRLNSKFSLKKSCKENFIKNMLFNKINIQQKVDNNNNNNNNNNQYEEKNKSNDEKERLDDKNDILQYPISEKHIIKNEDIKINNTNKNEIQLLEKKESEKMKNNIQKKKLPSLKNMLKMKEECYLKKFSKMRIKKSILEECVPSIQNKQNSKSIENFDDSSSDEFIDTKHSYSIKHDEKKISKRTVPLLLNKLSKIKLDNIKKFPIQIKKQHFKEHIINMKEKDVLKTDEKYTNSLYHENVQYEKNDNKHILKVGASFKSEDINEKEIEINKEQKDEDIKKEHQGMVTNYFTDLFNAFNFVNTPKEVGSFFDLKNNEDKILFDDNLIGKNCASLEENDKSDDEKEYSIEKANNNRDVMKLNIKSMNSAMIMEGNNINEENIKNDNDILTNSKNMEENKLPYIKTLRSLNFNKFPTKNNLKGYSIKEELLTKIKKKNNEEKIISMESIEYKLKESKYQSNSYICKDPILQFYTNKKNSSFLKDSQDNSMKNNPSNILRKILDSDLSNFNNMNKKRMTADEIAKHTNASLYITVKRKASQSSLTNSLKIIPKIKEKPKLSF